tara:strand:+ start:411 stop:602 length:192 start_codon:yes stop_codon:yes gene_type:complete
MDNYNNDREHGGREPQPDPELRKNKGVKKEKRKSKRRNDKLNLKSIADGDFDWDDYADHYDIN